jgi:putative hydrolase of the HAD superfamily
MIKAILFDLDNTLIDFMRMKRQASQAAIEAMIQAGVKLNKEDAQKILFELYDKYGI